MPKVKSKPSGKDNENQMKIQIITPDKTLFEGEAELVQLPGLDGSFELLNNHAPLISALKQGVVKIITIEEKKEDNEQFFEIRGGVIEVVRNKVLILAE